MDAARDAGNRWIFPELLDEDLPPWAGVTDVYLMGALEPTHAVDVTDTLPAGVDSLRAHQAYLDGLGRDFDPTSFCWSMLLPRETSARRSARHHPRPDSTPGRLSKHSTLIATTVRSSVGKRHDFHSRVQTIASSIKADRDGTSAV